MILPFEGLCGKELKYNRTTDVLPVACVGARWMHMLPVNQSPWHL